MTGIDTIVHGNRAQISAAAEWLSPTLKDGVDDAGEAARTTFFRSSSYWTGLSGESFRAVSSLMMAASDEVAGMCADVAEKLRSYAGQLERMEGHFADHRESATSLGMSVAGTVIKPPVSPLPYCPTEDDPRYAEYETYLDQIEKYDEIADDVAERREALQTWVDANLASMETTSATSLMEHLEEVNKNVLALYVEGTERTWQKHLDDLKERQRLVGEEIERVTDARRSGDPSVREPAKKVDLDGLKKEGKWLDDIIKPLDDLMRRVPVIGPGIDFVLGARDIAEGEEIGGVVVEVIAGIAGGALVAGGLALAGVTLPVWGTAVAVTAGAVAIGAGAKWAWEEFVPQEIRESIDAGIRDGVGKAWDATTDFAEDAWEAGGDLVDDVGDAIGSGWKSVFG